MYWKIREGAPHFIPLLDFAKNSHKMALAVALLRIGVAPRSRTQLSPYEISYGILFLS